MAGALLAGSAAGVAPAAASHRKPDSYVEPSLLAKANQDPDALVRVIVQADSTGDAQSAVLDTGDSGDGDRLGRKLALVQGVAAQMRAKRIAKLADEAGLIVTPDLPLGVTGLGPMKGFSSKQLWPFQSGNASYWTSLDLLGLANMPAIAIIDSGVDATRPDVAGRVIATATFATAAPNSPGDGLGHGTFVAGLAAGSAPGYTGAAPGAKLVSFMYDPLDKAVEQLWFAGITVVAAVGNYGAGSEQPVVAAPGNDPFAISVGAADLAGTSAASDDFAAPWSVYGFTYDGFRKPDVGAAGRYIVGPVPPTASLPLQRPDRVTAPGYMQLSGTSMASAVVSGTAAHILAAHPAYTPDQVKGAMMASSLATSAQPFSLGIGEIDAIGAIGVTDPPNPNAALEQFLTTDASDTTVFDADAWMGTAQSDPNWASANRSSWSSSNWSSSNWSSSNWSSSNWSSSSWSSANWSSSSWSSSNWSSSSWSSANWSSSNWSSANWSSANWSSAADLD
jgi:serine protease AprX